MNCPAANLLVFNIVSVFCIHSRGSTPLEPPIDPPFKAFARGVFGGVNALIKWTRSIHTKTRQERNKHSNWWWWWWCSM